MQSAHCPSPEPFGLGSGRMTERSEFLHGDTIDSLRRDLSMLSPAVSSASPAASRSFRSPLLPITDGQTNRSSSGKQIMWSKGSCATVESPAWPGREKERPTAAGTVLNRQAGVDVLHGGKVCSKETSDDGRKKEQRDAPSNCRASIECSSGRCHEERLGLLAEQARTTGLLELLQNDCAAARLEAARWEREVMELASRAAEVLWLRPLM